MRGQGEASRTLAKILLAVREPRVLASRVPPRRRHLHPAAEPLGPSEGWLIVQTSALVVFSSWTFGGMVSWSPDWILALALLGLPLVAIRQRETGELAWRPFVPALLWCGFVGIALANPSHVRVPGGSWAPNTDWIPWLPATVDPAHTIAAARMWLAALLQGGTVCAVLRSGRVARILWGVIALNGFALAAIGALFHFAQASEVLGAFEAPERTYFFSTFFYKNHWAAYGALAGVASLALALHAWRPAMAGDPQARGKLLLFGAAGLLTLVTLPLPGSRAGALLAVLLAGGFAAAALFLGWSARRASRLSRWPVIATVAGLTLGAVAYGWKIYAPRAAYDLERTRVQLTRGLDGETLDLRIPVSRDTWRMARERPWFGWGPGAFEIVFPVFQGNYLRRPDGRPEARFEFAHNDWLQMLAELGVIGAPLLLGPALFAAWRGWRRAGLPGRWALAGCALLAAYAWIDFPFHNPAVLLLWTLLVASAPGVAPRQTDEESASA